MTISGEDPRKREREIAFIQARARKLDQAREAKGLTKQKLADQAGYDVRTIRTLLDEEGVTPVKPRTIIDVSKVLGVEPELVDTDVYVDVSDERFGAYARASYKKYEGLFHGFRRSFSYPEKFVRTLVEIKWDEDQELLRFDEFQQYQSNGKTINNSQQGTIYISAYTDLLHLLTISQGAVRLITLTKMRGSDEILRGSILTQSERTMFFQPSVSAFYLQKISQSDPAEPRSFVGPVGPGDAGYDLISAEFERIEQDVMFIARPQLAERRSAAAA